MHIQAVSVKDCTWPPHDGGHHSAGHPDHADGMILGGGPPDIVSASTMTPCGSPGLTSWSGPTVDGGTAAGSFGFGTMSSGGGVIALENQPITTPPAPGSACAPRSKPTPAPGRDGWGRAG